MKTLTIRLTAPLQSYGNRASFSRRTTDEHPSKSAVLGMIAAAQGYKRDDPRIALLNDLSFAVRIDQPGRTLTDFQTAEWKKDTRKVTYRDYLQDAVFIVAIGGEENVIDNIAYSLKHPVYQIFLGRRSNAPAGILQLNFYADTTPKDVLEKLEWQASNWYMKRLSRESEVRLELIADANLLPNSHSDLVKDKVISFNQRYREFDYRTVVQQFVLVKNEYAEHEFNEGNHDAFGAW